MPALGLATSHKSRARDHKILVLLLAAKIGVDGVQ